jgi:hypothetical protein
MVQRPRCESGNTQSRCSGLSTAPQYAQPAQAAVSATQCSSVRSCWTRSIRRLRIRAAGALRLRLTAMGSAYASERRQRLRPAKINLHSHGLYRSPPCVCGRDVIEVTHGLAALASKGLLWL